MYQISCQKASCSSTISGVVQWQSLPMVILNTLFPAYLAIKRALVKEENDLLRPMWCYVFFLEGHFLNEIPRVIFFMEKNYHIFKWGIPF